MSKPLHSNNLKDKMTSNHKTSKKSWCTVGQQGFYCHYKDPDCGCPCHIKFNDGHRCEYPGCGAAKETMVYEVADSKGGYRAVYCLEHAGRPLINIAGEYL